MRVRPQKARWGVWCPAQPPSTHPTHPSGLPCSQSPICVLSGGASCLAGRPEASAPSRPSSRPAQSPRPPRSAARWARAGPGPRCTLWGEVRPLVPPALPSVPAGPMFLEPQDTLVWTQDREGSCMFWGGSPSTSTRPSVTCALAAATESASCTSSCNVFREPGGHPWDPAASHSGPCVLRSRKVAYTGGWGQDEDLTSCLTYRGALGPGLLPSQAPQIPLKLWEGSAARRRARCRPMPEEQPVMSTTVRSMGRACGRGSGLGTRYRLLRPAPAPRDPHPLLCLQHHLKAEPPEVPGLLSPLCSRSRRDEALLGRTCFSCWSEVGRSFASRRCGLPVGTECSARTFRWACLCPTGTMIVSKVCC